MRPFLGAGRWPLSHPLPLYLSFKRSDGNLPLQIFVLSSSVVYVGTRYWFSLDPLLYSTDPTALAAVLVAVAVAVLLIVSVFLRLASQSYAFKVRPLPRLEATHPPHPGPPTSWSVLRLEAEHLPALPRPRRRLPRIDPVRLRHGWGPARMALTITNPILTLTLTLTQGTAASCP